MTDQPPDKPVWNGRGEDPWLPHRLQAELDVAATERSIRNAVWAGLSGWLVRLSRRVLRSGRPPDTDAVWAMAPAWRETVDGIIEAAILPAMKRAYRVTTGDDGEIASRPRLARYLAEVRNRLVRVPDETFDLIAGEVSEGVNLGEGIPQLANRVDEKLSLTDSERWRNRAVAIARTESIGALNAARLESFRAMAENEPDVVFEKTWLATTGDGRTRPAHAAADGQRVGLNDPFIVGGFPMMFPGDPSAPADLCINCRCTMLLTEPLEELDYTNRQYRDQ